MVKKKWIFVLVALLALTANICMAEEKFPSRTITFINGYGPGGGTDILSRMALMKARSELGVPCIVANMPGAATVEATKYIQAQPADGYTVFVCTPTTVYNNPLSGRVSVMPEDWIPVIRAHIDVSSLMVRQDSPFKKWEDLLKYAKENPGKLNVGIMGALSVDELASAAIAMQAGIEVKLIPFEGGGEGMAALLGGHVDVLFEEPGVVMQLVESQKVRPLLLLSQEKVSRFPEVETLGDFGYKGVPVLWRGFVVKAGTPMDRVKIIEQALVKSMQSELYKAYERDSLLDLYPGGFLTSEAFAKEMTVEYEGYKAVMKKLGYLK